MHFIIYPYLYIIITDNVLVLGLFIYFETIGIVLGVKWSLGRSKNNISHLFMYEQMWI